MAKIRIGCSSWTFDPLFRTGRMTPAAWLELCGREYMAQGLTGLELLMSDTELPWQFPLTEAAVKHARERADHHGLELFAISPLIPIGRSLQTVPTTEAQARRMVDIAAGYGVPLVRIDFGWPDSASPDEWDAAVVSLRDCADYAHKRGVLLCVENSSHAGFVRSLEEVRRVMTAARQSNVGLVFDFGNCPDDPYEFTEWAASRSALIHAKMIDVDKHGVEHRFDYPRILQLLRKGGFEGYLSIEYEGSSPVLEVFPRALRYLTQLLQGDSSGTEA